MISLDDMRRELHEKFEKLSSFANSNPNENLRERARYIEWLERQWKEIPVFRKPMEIVGMSTEIEYAIDVRNKIGGEAEILPRELADRMGLKLERHLDKTVGSMLILAKWVVVAPRK